MEKLINIKQGQVDKIDNLDRKGNEAEVYYRVWVSQENELTPLFLTEHEMTAIKKRTEKHREDWINKGWIIEV